MKMNTGSYLKYLFTGVVNRNDYMNKELNEMSPCYESSLKENVLPSHTISGRELHPSLPLPTTEF